MLVDYKKHPSISTGSLAALVSAGATVGLGATLFAVFGLFLFSDQYPFLATLGAFGLGLAILFFPAFAPVSGLLAIPAVAVLLKRRAGRIMVRPFLAAFGVAILALAGCSGVVTTLLLLRSELAQRGSRQEEARRQTIEGAVIRVADLVVEQKDSGIDVRPIVSGSMAGKYHLRLSVVDQRPLVEEIRELTLPANATDLTVSIPLSVIQEGFRRVRMGGSRETVIVGPMDFRIRAQLSLLASDTPEASATLPPESPARRSEVAKTIRLELGRF